jgi:hypothetical protein
MAPTQQETARLKPSDLPKLDIPLAKKFRHTTSEIDYAVSPFSLSDPIVLDSETLRLSADKVSLSTSIALWHCIRDIYKYCSLYNARFHLPHPHSPSQSPKRPRHTVLPKLDTTIADRLRFAHGECELPSWTPVDPCRLQTTLFHSAEDTAIDDPVGGSGKRSVLNSYEPKCDVDE